MKRQAAKGGGWLAGASGLTALGYLATTVAMGGRHPLWPYLLFTAMIVIGLGLYFLCQGSTGHEAPTSAPLNATSRGPAAWRVRDLPGPFKLGVRRAITTDAAQLAGLSDLQPDIKDFTNRDVEIDSIMTAILRAQSKSETAVPLIAISGRGGIGKTALVVHIAHKLTSTFTDGQIQVDLRGMDATPADPYELLGELLAELGLHPLTIPDSLDRRARLFRSVLAGRRVLILLDNAASEMQLRPVIPGSPTCAVIVTSRRSLRGLAGCEHVSLMELTPASSRELLTKVAGEDRLRAEPDPVSEILDIAGGLPLALRIAGGKIWPKQRER
jgi:hypothetical protein